MTFTVLTRLIIALVVVVVVVAFSSCGSATISLSVSGDSNPEFKVGGAGVLVYFGVEEIDPQTKQRIGDYPLWGFDKRVEVQSLPMMWRLPAFKYGNLPSNDYKQVYPENFQHPPALEEGKWYKAQIHTPEKDMGEVVFQIKSGQVSNVKASYW
jgi:hypothetical protein